MSKRMPVLCQEYMIGFCLPLNIQATLNTQQQRRAPGAAPPHPPSHAPLLLCVRPWLNIQWQSKKHILLAEDGHIFLTCLPPAGTWVQNVFRNAVYPMEYPVNKRGGCSRFWKHVEVSWKSTRFSQPHKIEFGQILKK